MNKYIVMPAVSHIIEENDVYWRKLMKVDFSSTIARLQVKGRSDTLMAGAIQVLQNILRHIPQWTVEHLNYKRSWYHIDQKRIDVQ